MRWGGGGEGDWSYLGEIERTAALARRGREGGVEEERRRLGDWGRSERERDWGMRARAGIGVWRLGFSTVRSAQLIYHTRVRNERPRSNMNPIGRSDFSEL